MPEEPIATLIESNDKEGSDVTWKEVGSTPQMFLKWLVKRVAVDFSNLVNRIPIYFGPEKPKAQNSGKLHIQNSTIPRIGVFTDGGYKYFDQYPRNVILGWRGNKPIPNYFSTVSDAELEQLGLPKNVPNSLVWVVYPE
jgi:hypothetical protein